MNQVGEDTLVAFDNSLDGSVAAQAVVVCVGAGLL